jgi:hypothetical protein
MEGFSLGPRSTNADGFVNWLTTHLINAISKPAVMRTRARIDQMGGLVVCRIDVAASSSPVTARMSGGEEMFWVRMNNSTRDLCETEAEDYIRDHWSARRGPMLGPS